MGVVSFTGSVMFGDDEVAVVVIIFAMIDHATKQKHDIDAMNAI